jgi:exopolysaccharide biosynthesis protein
MTGVHFEPGAAERQPRFRVLLDDGAATTAHVGRFELTRVAVRVLLLTPPRPLLDCCREQGIADAIVGGFFIRSHGTPLGELRIDGVRVESQPFEEPWNGARSCVAISPAGELELGPRLDHDAEPTGDLLQAGPMLVAEGASVIAGVDDPEGFSSASAQFDSDITAGRYPRAALGIGPEGLIALVCDGRSDADAGLSMSELAAAMIELGAERAINLDGGGSASLVLGGELVNEPREEHGMALGGGRPVSTAIAFAAR